MRCIPHPMCVCVEIPVEVSILRSHLPPQLHPIRVEGLERERIRIRKGVECAYAHAHTKAIELAVRLLGD